MKLKINSPYIGTVEVQPRVELYSVQDFMGMPMPGLAIALDTVDDGKLDEFAMLTVSFGEFIGQKNCAYIDVNNCIFAPQLLDQGIAVDTGFTKRSGFCEYPLWQFKQEFLDEIGGEQYAEYAQRFDAYMQAARAMFDGSPFNDEESPQISDGGMALQ